MKKKVKVKQNWLLTGRGIEKIKFENINIREVQRFQIKNAASEGRPLYFRNCSIQKFFIVNKGWV